MARTIRTKIYKFEELSADAQRKVIEDNYDINTDYEWYDCVYEDAKEIGKIIGLDIDKIYFSGFSSQGDGACFKGSYSYQKECVKKIKEYAPIDEKLHSIAERLYNIQKENFYKISATIKQSGHYYHEYCTAINVYKDGDFMYFDGADKVEEEITDCLRDFMRWIYKTLDAEYEYLTSEDAIRETLEANEYEFTKDGNRF
ncbi:MAG: antitoxin of toxin-antitoxin stability system [Bacteroidota bacterium]